jgi:DNA replication and repair protein RecF
VWLRRLELTNFRSYAEQKVLFNDGVTLFIGPNGQGKTNLIEAICRVSTGQSHRNNSDQPLLRQDASPTLVRIGLETIAGRERNIDLMLGSPRPRIKLDGQDQRRSSDVIGVLRTVLFAPEDLAIVRGDPSERRRFLDDILSQRRSSYAGAKADYDRVLRQRNQLLKQLRSLPSGGQSAARGTLDAYTEQLITLATPLIGARLAGLRGLHPELVAGYHAISGKKEPLELVYQPALHADAPISVDQWKTDADQGLVPTATEIASALRFSLELVRREEEQRGVTLIGPHRDDIEFLLGSFPAKGYASHGETWSLTLALRLATREILTLDDDPPVVLLDDVFAELDERRRAHLAQACEAFPQVIVSAAVAADVPLVGEQYAVVKTDGVSVATKVST